MSLAKEAGYRGYHDGNYYIFNTKTSVPSTALKKLGFPKPLLVKDKDTNLMTICLSFKNYEDAVVELLQGDKYYEPEFNNQMTPGIGDTDSGAEQEVIIREDISIFKTVRTEGVMDPGAKKAGGLSILAFNNKSRVLLNGGRVSLDGILTILGTNREEAANSKNVPHVWPVFNPYTTELTFPHKDPMLSDRKITALNTAIPPRWMTHRSPGVKAKFHGFIKTLIEHLFPEEIERELVLDWCHYAIYKRNGTVLCLAGARGTGKSTFIKIVGELVGSDYTELVSESILKERFNAQFKNKRLIVFEEVALSDSSAINKVKAWCNNKISIEEKGYDAFSADNFSSMVFLLNDLNDLKVMPQERRFSIPVVAEENLWTVIDEVDIAKAVESIDNKTQEAMDMIAEFGEYLKSRRPKNSEYIPIKGANFNRVSDLSLTEWQGNLREYIMSKGEIGVKIPITVIFPDERKEKGERQSYPNKKSTISTFLLDYRHLGKYRLGEVVDIRESEMVELEADHGIVPKSGGKKTRRNYGIIPNKVFLENCGFKYIKVEDLV